MSLRWRIAVGLALIAAIVSSLASVGAWLVTAEKTRSGIDESLVSRVSEVSTLGFGFGPGRFRGRPGGNGDRDGGGPAGPGGLRLELRCPAPGALQPAAAAQLVTVDGQIVPCIQDGPELPVDTAEYARAAASPSIFDADRESLASAPPRLQTVEIDDVKFRVVTADWPLGGILQVARDLTENERVLDRLKWQLFLLASGSMLAAGALGWLVAGRIIRPVQRLRDAAEHIAATQDLSTPLPVEGAGEVGSLAQSLSTMVGALATSREQQQRLITDASHEMRTPLTSLRTNVELLQRADQFTTAQRREILDDVGSELVELTNLVGELVELATDRANADEPIERVELADLARGVAIRAQRRTGRTVVVDERFPSIVLGRAQMLERAISNLVDNALKYSEGPQVVEVVVDGGHLDVRDRGVGIDTTDEPYIFDRFYRATSARARPGSGLGLAIVKQIIDRHDGRVFTSRREGGGTVIGFDLPLVGRGHPDAVLSSLGGGSTGSDVTWSRPVEVGSTSSVPAPAPTPEPSPPGPPPLSDPLDVQDE